VLTSDVLRLTDAGVTVGISLDTDVDVVKALDRLKKQKDEYGREAGRLSAKLANPEFTEKAPSEVIQEHNDRLQLLANDGGILQRSEDQLRDVLRHRSA
jgi:valyl-tRNA synthetase